MSAICPGERIKYCSPIFFDITGADACIIFLQRCDNVAEAQATRHQPRGIGRHVELFFETADGVDLGHTGHLQKLRANHPILQGAQGGSVVGLSTRLTRLFVRMNGV